MNPQIIASLILLPFVVAFVYAGIHEYLRYRTEGPANYGLVYDEETGTTHVGGIAEDEEAFDPEEFDPNGYSDPEIADEGEEKKG
uniref:hypothetical protein n=1 Tax=Roseovarius indicus TaxID=540747 RepID=UPI003B525D6B